MPPCFRFLACVFSSSLETQQCHQAVGTGHNRDPLALLGSPSGRSPCWQLEAVPGSARPAEAASPSLFSREVC